jgi:hypothetical protein
MGMEIVEEEDEKLIRFYKEIVTLLEGGNVTEKELEALQDFYIQFKLVNETVNNEDVLKYMYLGWYIHNLRNDLRNI